MMKTQKPTESMTHSYFYFAERSPRKTAQNLKKPIHQGISRFGRVISRIGDGDGGTGGVMNIINEEPEQQSKKIIYRPLV